uniref:hypothetical protein n=1 Tax=Gemmiger formicilis TaxID=745368 RepID=UPI003FEFCA45
MKKITVLDIKFFPHTVRWYRRKKSKQDSTQVSCFDGFAHIETTDGMRTAHVRVICDPMEKPDKICTVHKLYLPPRIKGVCQRCEESLVPRALSLWLWRQPSR